MRGFLDVKTQEIVIYDDSKGKELFRIGGQGQQRQVAKPITKTKLNTLTFVICNGSTEKQTATLFASNLEPLIQPLGVSVIIKEIEKQAFNTHNYLRRDILSNKLKVVGFSYFVENQQQLVNDLQFGTIKPYGVVEMNPFSPLNYMSANQIATNMMDLSTKFNWDVDARSILYVPIEPKSKVTLLFNVLEEVREPLVSEYQNTIENRPLNYIENRPLNYIQKRPVSYIEKRPSYVETRPISYDANESNTVFKNINSGGLGAVNFDGGNDFESQNISSDKRHSAVMSVIKLGIVVAGAVLIVNAISKFKK